MTGRGGGSGSAGGAMAGGAGRPGTRAPAPLVVTDGRAGNRAQALGLAEAILRAAPDAGPITEREIALRRWAAWLPAPAWQTAAGRVLGLPAAGLEAAGDALAPPPGRLVIGAGRRAAPVVAALGRRHGAATVQLLDPRMDPAAFDIVAAPAHDGLEAANAVATLGSVGRVTRAGIAAAAAALPGDLRARIEALPAPRLAVLLGGGSASARWDGADGDAFVEAMRRLAGEGWSLLVTASRRTDPVITHALAEDLACDGHLLHVGAGPNPYPAMLAFAEAVLVTADSVNMASEAAASGLPVHVFPVAHLDGKLRAFHHALGEQGAARPFEGSIGQWRYEPLSEADRLARIVLDRLDMG